jgi:hypothetical protein
LPRIKNPPKEDKISPNEIITCETYVGLYGPQIKIPDGVDWFENNDSSSFNSTKEPLTYYVTKISSSVQFKQIKNLTAVNLWCCTTFKREKLTCVLVEKSTINASTRESIKLNSCNTPESSTKVSTSTTKSIESSTITSSPTTTLLKALPTSTTTITTFISNRSDVILIKTQMLLFLIILSRILEW